MQGSLQETDHKINEGTITMHEHAKRILCVDDNKDTVFIVEKMLTHLGYDITGCVDPREALEIFRESPYNFDLVITDLEMPEMDGFRLVHEISRIRIDIPVLLMTGSRKNIDKIKDKISGIIVKPSDMGNIEQAIKRVFDGE